MDHLNQHFVILSVIMIVCGAFGGFLNHVHNFDTTAKDEKNSVARYKYIFLGIAAALLVPAFLKMIASDLISNTGQYDSNSYLVFAGFCLIAAIFSRRFISSIGERILEAARNAEALSKENSQQIVNTKRELNSAQERIEDVKLAVDLNSTESLEIQEQDGQPLETLLSLVDAYESRTTIPDYAERVKAKAELARKMGEIIIRHNLPRTELFEQHPKEGMCLALAYSVQLRPGNDGAALLGELARSARQLYTKGTILTGYKTLFRAGFIQKEQIRAIYAVARQFREGADTSLLSNIEDLTGIIRIVEPEA